MKEELFPYSVEPTYILREKYIAPYRYSKELQEYVIYMFQHPKHFRYRTLFTKLLQKNNPNAMLDAAYLVVKEYQTNPQQYGHQLDTLVPVIIVRMWKTFLGLHKYISNQVYTQYYPTDMKLLIFGKGKFLELLLEEITEAKYIGHGDDMVKVRINKYGKQVGLRERIMYNEPYTNKEFEDLCKLE